MKIGIMGGTFDPIHTGHLILGEFAYQEFHLDKVWFMLNGNPPHKVNTKFENELQHRIQMTRLAIEPNPHFELCLHEADSSKHSYTSESMRELKEQYPENEFYFILGADSLFAIETWYHPENIFPNCTILAAVRDAMDQSAVEGQIAFLKTKYNARIEFLHSPMIDISSTAIRERRGKNETIRYIVPDAVGAYITEKGLYQAKD